MRKIAAYIVIGPLAATIVSPSPVSAFGLYFGPFHIGFGHRHRLAHHPHFVAPSPDKALTETNTQAVQSCGGLAPGVTNLPIEEIRQTVHPTADQEAALDDLSAASSKANDIIKSSCPTAPPLTPVGRLGAAEQRLEAMIRAAQIVRSPFERLYDSLSDEQRRQFNAMGNSGKGKRPRPAIWRRSVVNRREQASRICRCSASSRWCDRIRSSKTRSPISRRRRKMPLAISRHPAQLTCRKHRWRGSMQSQLG